ncbi:bifunctional diguanylate cyclase/phosphodiesterase [Natronospirillum operosum]|uniref:Bifunctional diguanylate cyclase/phosphodiesterase n=1 Tax=Natronospirillum operosum TaxID=2759953 RepID=A0A4Z0WCE8_9GAMM|nr:bifunctional diguanylate cyclase/phosphodiesterase [Natronospirillum operosum]TGG95872.1 bifunctional diguanylate cyclase/phosphodiesterase [Natronospirillum operosum]
MTEVSNRALRLTLIYLVFGSLWIAFSDQALAMMVDDPQLMALLQTLKGWFFVLVTGLLFFLLARRALADQKELMRRDGLTGLLNRGVLRDEIDDQIRLLQGQGQHLALFFVNIDGFKQINATLGQAAGDNLLLQLASQLRREFEATGPIGRIGADEFVVTMRASENSSQLDERALRIMACCRRIQLPQQTLQFSCGIGVSLFPDDGGNARELLASGAVALEQAKAAGPGQYRLFNRAFSESFEDSLKLVQDLRLAIQERSFDLVYQPQFAVASGQVTGVEVLLRWEHPERGPVPPARFIRLAEQQGLIHDITRIVLEKMVAELRGCDLLGTVLQRVSINVSAQEFGFRDYLDDFFQLLARNEDVCQYLQFEITETAIMSNLEASLDTMERLRRMGIRFSIDDFGTGYSSLHLLKRLPLHELKIDRSFISDLPHDANDAMIARTIIVMAQSLKMRLVAEGVETEAQRQFLADNGCDEMQGFLLARPMPVEQLHKLLNGG